MGYFILDRYSRTLSAQFFHQFAESSENFNFNFFLSDYVG